MRLSDSEAILARALDDMNKKWTATGGVWSDKARDEFERKHVEELRSAVIAARHAMRNIDTLLRQVIRECS